ncbi:MaoC family dehydratase N-terminal domain-containing protein [Hydrogenophaga sp.]|uniref:FAS1-like dehydratase domain-containing protein n=1 Tax=Hydrogenophaga sp. TaxID=1904254 RepID=UPI00271C107B|nr:MaoC family dehydratase N-terminal domain-containing protein [Hydrogenophaga sp.]MDO9437529.1 MaoC family dehydratase N-terminal domain-containing protein [Hydrogenophaga sp.]
MNDAPSTADRLAEFVGRQGAAMVSPDPVNAAMIRHWCAALGDENPSYAETSTAPAAMLQVWTMPGWKPAPCGPDAVADLYAYLDGQGYTSIVATDSEQDYLRALRHGETVTATKTIASISDEKSTGLGRGFFITSHIEIVDAQGEPVGRQLHRVLKFKPPEKPIAAPAAASTTATNAADIVDVDAGKNPPVFPPDTGREQLPRLLIALDRSTIVATAIATRDYQPVHHDPDYARRAGSQDIFMNILTTQGLVARYVTDWAGPRAVVRRTAIRLGASNYPGDTMVMTGEVLSRQPAAGGGEDIELAVRGRNRLGDHVKGSAVVTVPNKATTA